MTMIKFLLKIDIVNENFHVLTFNEIKNLHHICKCCEIVLFLFKVTFLTFFTYVISDPDNNILTAEKIFVSMALFYTMHLPLGLLPLIVVAAVEVVPHRITDWSFTDAVVLDIRHYNIITNISHPPFRWKLFFDPPML